METRPKARERDLVVESVDQELLVYDLERDRGHCLNDTAALVFEHCDGTRTAAELAAHLSAETGREIDEEVVERALARLGDEGLLEEPVRAPANGRDWSRRQVLVRVGVAGAAAGVGLPVVKSIVAPTAAHAQSCIPENASCGALPTCAARIPCCPGLSCLPGEVDCVCTNLTPQ
jgi:hypothetical protein